MLEYVSISFEEAKASVFPEIKESWGDNLAINRVSAPEHAENREYYKVVNGNGELVGMFAIFDGFHIVTLVKVNRYDVKGSDILALAVSLGGKSLDSFDGNEKFYSRNNFVVVSREPLDGDTSYLPANEDNSYVSMVLDSAIVGHENEFFKEKNEYALGAVAMVYGINKINPWY